MKRRDQVASYSLFILAVLISLGTILQILGLPFTFSNPSSSSDLFESSVLEGFTMVVAGHTFTSDSGLPSFASNDLTHQTVFLTSSAPFDTVAFVRGQRPDRHIRSGSSERPLVK